MIKQTIFSILFLVSFTLSAQISLSSDRLYEDNFPLKIKLGYSNKQMNKKTNDSTYIKVPMEFFHDDKWNTIEVSLRARGNFRRSQCYFPPIKMKIKKDVIENTLFDGNKTMKLVMPCKLEKENNDNVLQEYIAYKMYELSSPYHFKTRLVSIDFSEPKGKKVKKGDSLFVLEAMKMEKVITAPIPGTQVEFNVKKGQAVNKGDVLAEISI